METSQTIVESQIIELTGTSFNTFCEDISGMFGIDMKCVPLPVGHENVKQLQTRFQDLAVVYSARAEGALDSTLKLVFDQQGLFILAGVVAMQPEQIILEDVKSGSLEKAAKVSSLLQEVGTALIGACERVFSKGLDDHERITYTDTFIGNPWDNPQEKIGLAADEEFIFVQYEMTVGSYPAFKCGAVFPKTIFNGIPEPESDQVESDDQTAQEATDETAQIEPEQAAQEPAEENIEADAESTVQVEAEEETQIESEQAAQEPAEENIEPDTEPTEPTVQVEAEEESQIEPEQAAQEPPEQNIVTDTEQTSQDSTSQIEELDSDESDTTQKSDDQRHEQQESTVEVADEEQMPAQENNEEITDAEEGTAAEEKVQSLDEEIFAADDNAPEQEPEAATGPMPDVVEQTTAVETGESREHPVSDTIKKMAESQPVYPDQEPQSKEIEDTTPADKDKPLIIFAKDVMQQNVIWANPDDSVQQALAKIQQYNADYMMVGRENVLEGIVSKSDLTGALSPYLRTIFAKWRRPLDDATLKIRIKWIMSKPTCTVVPDTPLVAIMENMCRSGIRCLPVVDEQGGVQGLVTAFDIFRILLKQSYLS